MDTIGSAQRRVLELLERLERNVRENQELEDELDALVSRLPELHARDVRRARTKGARKLAADRTRRVADVADALREWWGLR
jgi:predicted nuclease with TOPRIM domain